MKTREDRAREAVRLANRFIIEAAEWLRVAEFVAGTRVGGAMMRASMDLSRALSDLRQNGRKK